MTAGNPCLHDLIVNFIASKEVKLPVFNPVALRLQQALHDETAKIADLERMIVEDQVLASQILRVANAAFYKGLQEITTLARESGEECGQERHARVCCIGRTNAVFARWGRLGRRGWCRSLGRIVTVLQKAPSRVESGT